jgi:hypothetical protein
MNNHKEFESTLEIMLHKTLKEDKKELANNLEIIEKLLIENKQNKITTLLRRIDQKAQDYSTYLLAAYSDTKDIKKSIEIFELVRYLVRYILIFDLYNEGAGKQYSWMSKEILKIIKQNVNSHSWASLQNSIAMFSPFWKFEKDLQRRMIKGDKFTLKEIRYHNLLKSRDAFIYSTVLYHELPTFTQNICNVIHYNQALQDLEDDFDDIADDIKERMPNIFVLNAISNNNHHQKENNNKKLSFSTISDDINNNKYILQNIIIKDNTQIICSWAYEYLKWIESTVIPDNYYFLIDLGRHYFSNLKNKLNNVIEIQH